MNDDERARRKKRLLLIIYNHNNKHGFSPTLRWLAENARVPMSSVVTLVKVMHTEGLVTRDPGNPRTIRVTDAGKKVANVL